MEYFLFWFLLLCLWPGFCFIIYIYIFPWWPEYFLFNFYFFSHLQLISFSKGFLEIFSFPIELSMVKYLDIYLPALNKMV